MLPYTSPEEVSLRVVNTVISCGNDPVYVHEMGRAANTISISELPMLGNRPSVYKDWRDPLFNAHDIRLGYCNYQRAGRELPYITRMPARHAHQGINQRSLHIPLESGIVYDHLLRAQAFVDMWHGKYPALEEAIQTVTRPLDYDKPVTTVAFNRRWAVSYDHLEMFYLWYRGRKIAAGTDPSRFKLPNAARHLRELVEAQGLRVVA